MQEQNFLQEPTLEEWQVYIEQRYEAAEQWFGDWLLDLLFIDKIQFPIHVDNLRSLVSDDQRMEEDFTEISRRDFAEIITLRDVAVYLHRYKDADFAAYRDELVDRDDQDGIRLYQSVAGMMPK